MTKPNVTFDILSESAIRGQIEIKAPPEKAYAAWTEPEQLRKWFGPKSGGSLIIDDFECRIEGKFDFTMVFADGDRAQMTGRYLVVDPPNRLVFTWQWKEGANISSETLVTVELAPTQLGTRLTLTHERFTNAEARNNHQEGWDSLLIRLASYLDG